MRLTELVEVRRISGSLAVSLLRLIGLFPLWIPLAVGNALLSLYIPFRRRTRARLGKLSRIGIRVAPHPYYRMRLRLALLSLKHLLGRPEGCTLTIEGQESYAAALATGKPVVVLGWHQGPVELLHRIPQSDPNAAGRAAFLMTAKAFAPALTALMKSGRAGMGKEIIHPHSLSALKRWEKEAGVLALMVDQVPGAPEEWLAPLNGALKIPFPERLIDWLAEREAVFVAVTVRLDGKNRIIFRYESLDPSALRDSLAVRLDRAVRAAPDQYNWSYPKIEFH